MYPDSTQALTWNAWAYYDMNVTGATWNWGDGSTSNGLYPSHTYSAAGIYTICVTETVQCGATASVCSSYNIYKSATQNNAMIKVNVKNPYGQTTGLKTNSKESISELSLYPNPTSGRSYISFNSNRSGEIQVTVSNIAGAVVMESRSNLTEGSNSIEIKSNELAKGFYIVTLSDGNGKRSLRLIKD
jgi:hypothetical protein